MRDELTPKEREKLAVDVMGWKYLNYEGTFPYYKLDDKKEGPILYVNAWKPDQNIEQAFGLLDKFPGDKKLTLRADGLNFCHFPNGKIRVGDTLEIAICRAVLAAMGEL